MNVENLKGEQNNMSSNKKHREIKEYLWSVWKESDRYGNFIVELDQDELAGAKEVAIRRYQNNRNDNKRSPKLSNEKQPIDYSRDILGAAGEMAAIKWLKENGYNADFSKFINVENKGGEQDDFDTDIVFDGESYTVEVKTTSKPLNSKLIYPYHKGNKKNQPDIFLLVCQIDATRHVIKGFTTKDEVLSNVDTDLPTKAYSIHEKRLEKDLNKVATQIKISKKGEE